MSLQPQMPSRSPLCCRCLSQQLHSGRWLKGDIGKTGMQAPLAPFYEAQGDDRCYSSSLLAMGPGTLKHYLMFQTPSYTKWHYHTHFQGEELDAHLWLHSYPEHPTKRWRALGRNGRLTSTAGGISTVIFLSTTSPLPAIASFLSISDIPFWPHLLWETFSPWLQGWYFEILKNWYGIKSWPVSIGAWYG